eukprot:217824-Pelagomonas_calceolata.AAC.1
MHARIRCICGALSMSDTLGVSDEGHAGCACCAAGKQSGSAMESLHPTMVLLVQGMGVSRPCCYCNPQ